MSDDDMRPENPMPAPLEDRVMILHRDGSRWVAAKDFLEVERERDEARAERDALVTHIRAERERHLSALYRHKEHGRHYKAREAAHVLRVLDALLPPDAALRGEGEG